MLQYQVSKSTSQQPERIPSSSKPHRPSSSASGTDGKQTFKMKALEILDLSRNSISTIPTEISQMGPLRVLSLADNLITEVPYFFGNMDALQILKLLGNRLVKQEILNIVARTIEPVSPSLRSLSENKREAAVTKTLKEWMKQQQTGVDPGNELVKRQQAGVDSGNEWMKRQQAAVDSGNDSRYVFNSTERRAPA